MTDRFWGIYSIHKLYQNKREDLLPCGLFTLYHKKDKVKVSGFLPTHHSDVDFKLKLSKPNDKNIHKIIHIIHMRLGPRKKKTTSVSAFCKEINTKTTTTIHTKSDTRKSLHGTMDSCLCIQLLSTSERHRTNFQPSCTRLYTDIQKGRPRSDTITYLQL